jgi:hypothetical protein
MVQLPGSGMYFTHLYEIPELRLLGAVHPLHGVVINEGHCQLNDNEA